jgi:hypothetical protein
MGIGDVLSDLSIDLGLVEDRAGRYARDLARSRQKAYLKASWRHLVIPLVLAVAAVGLTIFLPPWARGFVAGAWLATVVCLGLFVVVQGSGTGPAMMGASAEQWTAQELRRLRGRGWRVVSHVMPSYGDVDHIAVGPGGLIVAETKWMGDPSKSVDECWRRAVSEGVRKNARQIRLALRTRLGDAPVRAVVVYWGPVAFGMSESAPVDVTGVTVLPGAALRGWLESTAGESGLWVTSADICSAWETLSGFAQQTDRRELGPSGLVRRTPTRLLADATIGIVAGLAFFLASFVALRLLGAVAFVPVGVLAGVTAVSSRAARTKTNGSARMLMLGMLVGTSAYLVVAAGLYAYVSLVHN